MASIATLCDTPLRHNENSVTKTSLRSKVLRRNNRTVTGAKQKSLEDGCVDESKINVPILEDTSKSDCDMSVISANGEKSDELVRTQCEDFEFSRISPVRMNKDTIFQVEKHSTPRYLKYTPRAVSSTPSQEIMNTSKLIRCAASQTLFTLSDRDNIEISEELQLYCNVILDEQSDSTNCSEKIQFSVNSMFTSPIRNVCSKIISCETPVAKKQFTRKLSLRSKTMICSAIEKTRNKSSNFKKYKSFEDKCFASNTFSLLPRHKSPSPCTSKILHNPFEADLTERLSKSIFSPDVFDKVISPSEDSEDLRWTIDDISLIKPVPIEEDFYFQSDDEDPERESQVQQEIDRYFSETHVVLSPYNESLSCDVSVGISQTKETMRLGGAVASTPQKQDITKDCKSVNTQTDMALPPVLPEHIKDSLRYYFKFYDGDELNTSASNLRRKLFFHSEDEPPSPVRFETYSNPLHMSKKTDDNSPAVSAKEQRYLTPTASEVLSSPDMSPVVGPGHTSLSDMRMNASMLSCKKTLHHYFADDSTHIIERRDDISMEPKENSTVIMASEYDSESGNEGETSALMVDSYGPLSSQDTGYHTEESTNVWGTQCGRPEVTGYSESTWEPEYSKLTAHFGHSMMASTPTRRVN